MSEPTRRVNDSSPGAPFSSSAADEMPCGRDHRALGRLGERCHASLMERRSKQTAVYLQRPIAPSDALVESLHRRPKRLTLLPAAVGKRERAPGPMRRMSLTRHGQGPLVLVLGAGDQGRVNAMIVEVEGGRPDEASRPAETGEDESEKHWSTLRWHPHSPASGAGHVLKFRISHAIREWISSAFGQ
jgi:hypothetical protein